MDQNLDPYRPLLAKSEILNLQLDFYLSLVLFSLGVLGTPLAILNFLQNSESLFGYFGLFVILLLLLSAVLFSRAKDRSELKIYSILGERMSMRLLMEHGLITSQSLPPLAVPLSFSDLNNEPVQAIIQLGKNGSLQLHRLIPPVK